MTADARLVGIIPARGGSKGIVGKNLVEVAGKPLIGWLLDECARARRLGRYVVSTDDDDIAAVASEFGAEVIRRPAELSRDDSVVEGALLHALDAVECDAAGPLDRFVFMQCTSPLTLAEDIDGAIGESDATEADVVVSVTDFHYFLWAEQADGTLAALNHDHRVRPMRQDRPGQLIEAGSVYVLRTQGFRRARHRFYGRIAPYRVPADRVFEIDEPQDLAYAEFVLSTRRSQSR